MTQPTENEWPALTPTAIARQRVRELRMKRGLSARELAELVQSHGIEMDRDVIANFETGRRQGLSIDELVVLALVLDVSPVDLILRDDEFLQVGSWGVVPPLAARWARGDEPLPSQNPEAWQAERSAVRSGPGHLASPADVVRALRDAGLEIRTRNDNGKR